MFKALFRLIGRLIAFVWRAFDFVRRALFNLVFIVLVVALLAAFWRPAMPLPERAALHVRPAGMLVEERSVADPLALLSSRPLVSETSLADLLEAIDSARDDARISALVLETDDLEGGGLSKLAELRAALQRFRDSGKPVFARGERFTQGQYYLASAASELHLAPDGFVLVSGLSRYLTYFKGALDSLGVKMHVFRVGEYKSFSEPFTRSDMSDEDRESSRDLLGALWNVFRNDVSAARKLNPDAFDRYVADYPDQLAAQGGDAAAAALAAGLVDRLSSRDEWLALLKERVGTSQDGSGYQALSAQRYLAQLRATRVASSDKVAVIAVQGSIVDGEGSSGSAGGDAIATMIRQARDNPAIKALVMRIDSPGGSAWASELIRREMEITRKAGKPVVASMSSTAASGGYWIAAGADEIWAHPATVTGSIGVFALFPEFAQPLERLGVTVDGVATGPLAGALDPRRPLAPAAASALQSAIEHSYGRFLRIVGEARRMTVNEVDQVARGRVWTGEAASRLGLVDQLGGFTEAVQAAAKRAGLDRFDVVWPDGELTPGQRLMRRLGDMAQAVLPQARPATSPLERMLADLHAETRALLDWNDPQHVYAHCLCASP